MEMQIDAETAVREQSPSAGAPPHNTLPPGQRAMLPRPGQPLTMTRVGKPHAGVSLIVGMWKYTHATGAIAYERFTSDGEMVLLVEMQGREGTYVVRSDRVDVFLSTGNHTFTRIEDTLVATGSNGQAVTLRRAPR